VVRSNLVESMLVVFLGNSCLVVVVEIVFGVGIFPGLVVDNLVVVILESFVALGLVVLRVYFVLLGLA